MNAWETTAPHSRYVAEKFPPVPGYALRIGDHSEAALKEIDIYGSREYRVGVIGVETRSLAHIPHP